MTTKTGGRLLVDALLEQGCDRIFTVPGESFLAVLDALHDTPAIDMVTCRQEGGVTFMACADGTLTGRPGVAFVTRGPGATCTPIAALVAPGRVWPSSRAGRGRPMRRSACMSRGRTRNR